MLISRAIASAVFTVVSGDHHSGNAFGSQLCDGRLCVAFQSVGNRNEANGLAISRDNDDGFRSRLMGFDVRKARGEHHVFLLHKARISDHHRGVLNAAFYALARDIGKVLNVVLGRFLCAGRPHNGLRQWMLREPFKAGSEARTRCPANCPAHGAQRSVTPGRPSVRVPVLSSTTASILLPRSSASPFLIRMPRRAPSPVPTIMAVGVARPSEQGQAINRTATAGMRLCATSPVDQVPADGCGERDAEHDRHEDPGHLVGKFLNGGFVALRFGDHAHDLRKHSILANFGGAHLECAREIDGRTEDFIAWLLS